MGGIGLLVLDRSISALTDEDRNLPATDDVEVVEVVEAPEVPGSPAVFAIFVVQFVRTVARAVARAVADEEVVVQLDVSNKHHLLPQRMLFFLELVHGFRLCTIVDASVGRVVFVTLLSSCPAKLTMVAA